MKWDGTNRPVLSTQFFRGCRVFLLLSVILWALWSPNPTMLQYMTRITHNFSKPTKLVNSRKRSLPKPILCNYPYFSGSTWLHQLVWVKNCYAKSRSRRLSNHVIAFHSTFNLPMSAAQTFNSWSMTSLVKSFFVADRCHVLISRNIIICYHCSYKRVEEPYCFITISFSWSPLSTNMRIPNTAEFIALFVSTGQLTGLQNQRKIDVILFMINTRLTHVDFHFI